MDQLDPERAACPPGCDGTEHPRCKGHNNRKQCCGSWPIRGGVVCGTHGGQAPQVRAAAQRRVVEGQVRAALAWEGVTVEGDLIDHLLGAAGRAMAMREALGAMVNALPKVTYTTASGVEAPRAVVTLYERAQDRETAALLNLAKLGIDERRVRIAEGQGRLMAGGLSWLLGEFGMSGDPDAMAKIDTMLTALAEGRLPTSADSA